MVSTPAPADALLSPGQVAARLAAEGVVVSRMTIFRWLKAGLTVGGRKVRLRGERVGGKWLVAWPAVAEFRRECTAAAGAPPDRPETAAERRRAVARAVAQIDRNLRAK